MPLSWACQWQYPVSASTLPDPVEASLVDLVVLVLEEAQQAERYKEEKTHAGRSWVPCGQAEILVPLSPQEKQQQLELGCIGHTGGQKLEEEENTTVSRQLDAQMVKARQRLKTA